MGDYNDYNIDDFLKNFDRNLDDEVKNEGNQNNKKNTQSSPKKDYFNLNIDHSKEFVDDEEGYIPAYNGEIYFANHTPLKPKVTDPKVEKKYESIKERAKKRINPIPINVSASDNQQSDDENSSTDDDKITPSMVAKAAKIRLQHKFGKTIRRTYDNEITDLDKKSDVNEFVSASGKIGNQTGAQTKTGKRISLKSLKKKYRKKSLLAIAVSVILAVLLSIVAISCINDVLAIGRDSETIYTITIPNGATTKSVIHLLDKQGLIKNSIFCNIIAEMQHFRSDNYIPGIYYVTKSMGLEGMLLHFKSTQVTGDTVRLVFPEGYNVDQIMAKLEKYEVCTSQLFKQTMKDVDFSSEYDFLASIKDKEQRYHYLEGYMYPDTYDFYVGENPASVIRKFLDNFKEKWTDEYQEKAKSLNMTMDEVITLASIIQKEAYGADQMPDVSSVIHNRLNYSALFPTLKCDCTYYYVKNYIDENVEEKSLANALNNRYNTNDCIGLPIGAICNPGGDAIDAALNPNDTKYYFFAHDANNKIYLAANESEHNSNLLEINEVNKNAKAENSN